MKLVYIVPGLTTAVIAFYLWRRHRNHRTHVTHGGAAITRVQFLQDSKKAHARNFPPASPHPLDVTTNNILQYPQGSIKFVWSDLEPLPAEFREGVKRLLAGLDHALSVRRELINFKKVCLMQFWRCVEVEKDLKRLVMWTYQDVERNEDGTPKFAFEARDHNYRVLCQTLQRSKAMRFATHDARDILKFICCLPRHPSLAPNTRLQRLPDTLQLFKRLQDARGFLAECRRAEAAEGSPSDAGTEEETRASDDAMRACAAEFSMHAGLDRVMEDVRALGMPPHLLEYVRCVLIARGAAKALAMHQQLEIFTLISEQLPLAMRVELRRLQATQERALSAANSARPADDVDRDALLRTRAMQCDRHIELLGTCAEALTEVARWLARIGRGSLEARLFVAGDSGVGDAAMFLPKDFTIPALIAAHEQVVRCCKPVMREGVLREGWPPPLSARRTRVAEHGKNECWRCKHKFATSWAGRGVCWQCEEACRDEGTCPFHNRKCHPGAWCPHHRKCVLCDAWSCNECRLLVAQGGEDVSALVARLQPSHIFLDFDRTFCSTKRGASPLHGQHALDPDLASLACSHPNVHVVTRNSHQTDIEAFLGAQGLASLSVHVVKRPRSKAEVILAPRGLDQGDAAATASGPLLFVDDEIREHVDPALSANERVWRVLFTRGF